MRAGLQREDDYAAPGKPTCDWQDRQAREALVDALVRDGYRAHYALRDQRLEGLSDREAADRFAFDVRWRYAAGVADAVAGEETASFA